MVSDLLSEFTDKLLTVMIEVTKSEAKTDKDNIETDRQREMEPPSDEGTLSLHPRCGTRNPVAASVGMVEARRPARQHRRPSGPSGGRAGGSGHNINKICPPTI